MRWAVGVVAAVVVAGLGWAAWTSALGGTGDGERGDAAAVPSATASARPSSGPAPSATAVSGSEVLPPEPGSASARLPARTPAAARVTTPLPADASGESTLVDGYPADLIAPITGDAVIANSVASEPPTLQAAMSARSDLPPAQITEHYRSAWSALGLDATVTADGLSAADAYTALTLVVGDASTGTVYTLYATLRTE